MTHTPESLADVLKERILRSLGGASGGLIKITCPQCEHEEFALVYTARDLLTFHCRTTDCLAAYGPRHDFKIVKGFHVEQPEDA